MSKRMNEIWNRAKLGAILGGAIGTILNGVALTIPGGREVVIVKAICLATATATKAITVSGTAVGTIVGAVSGALTQDEPTSDIHGERRKSCV